MLTRRHFLHSLLLFIVSKCAWANRNSTLFSNQAYADILAQLFPQQPLKDSELIQLHIPEVAENGAMVPLTITSELTDMQRIYVLVEKNPTPLAAEFILSPQVAVQFSARIKMAESCHVVVLAQHGEEVLKTQRWVKVVVGGCGSG
jgi:sulfur-oxidizing protein SoxY